MILTSEQIDALRILAEECEARDIQFALIGASVLEVYLKVQELPVATPRRTRDLDAVLGSANWEEYESVRGALLSRGFRSEGSEPEHRLFFGKTEIDLLPCSPGVANGGRLVWPKAEMDMSVLGFPEALKLAEPVSLAPDLQIPVAPLWLIAYLKAVAYLESGGSHHLTDIVWILSHYEEQADASSRRFDVHEEGVDYETSGAYLVGKDMAVNLAAGKLKLIERLCHLFGPTGDRPYPSEAAEPLFLALQKGLSAR